jgi:hypothetical protein
VSGELAGWQKRTLSCVFALIYFFFLTSLIGGLIHSVCDLALQLHLPLDPYWFNIHPIADGFVFGALAGLIPLDLAAVATGMFAVTPEVIVKLHRFRRGLQWLWLFTTAVFLLFSFAVADTSAPAAQSVLTTSTPPGFLHTWLDIFFLRHCPALPSRDILYSMQYECASQLSVTYMWVASVAFSAATWISLKFLRAEAPSASCPPSRLRHHRLPHPLPISPQK